jgi:ABC-type branched-subunit amino acid transport system substrate-binding protein
MRSSGPIRFVRYLPYQRTSLVLQLAALCCPLLWLSISSSRTLAQTDAVATKPYATLDRETVTYRGPAHPAETEASDNAAVIGMILPLKGPQQLEGRALLFAARLAMEEEQTGGPLPDGKQLRLAVRDESGPWGQTSTEILKLFQQDHALAILTSANGNSAHLAEQIANKISIPILTLSSDPSTTQANVPWLFRLGPSDTDQARAFCQHIYSDLGLRRVLLIVQMDHDGRVGSAEFEKAAKELRATNPLRFEVTDSPPDLVSLRELLPKNAPQAIVLWTDAPTADALLPILRSSRPTTPVFLCRKAAQLYAPGISTGIAVVSSQDVRSSMGLFTVGSFQSGQTTVLSRFQQEYFTCTGTNPGFAANEVSEAIHRIAAALRTTGANRVLLRDYLASTGKSGATEILPFDPAGNRLQEFTIVSLRVPGSAKP